MVYRDWLCSLSPVVMSYVHEISHKRRKEMNQQMIALYDLVQDIGKADFVAALELAAEQQMYGVEYLRAIVSLPPARVPCGSGPSAPEALALTGPPQPEVELFQYRGMGTLDGVATDRHWRIGRAWRRGGCDPDPIGDKLGPAPRVAARRQGQRPND